MTVSPRPPVLSLSPPRYLNPPYILHMTSIHKYNLELEDTNVVVMPKGAKPLSIQLQGGHPVLWAEVDTEVEATEFRRFRGLVTGAKLPKSPGTYISTVQTKDGFVFHFYEV